MAEERLTMRLNGIDAEVVAALKNTTAWLRADEGDVHEDADGFPVLRGSHLVRCALRTMAAVHLPPDALGDEAASPAALFVANERRRIAGRAAELAARVSEPPPPRLLLVEGTDDKHVVEHLCRKLASHLAFCCRSAGGADPLLRAIPLEMKPDERNVLGILMDANADVSARWQAIGDRLHEENVHLPNEPEEGGTIIEGDLRVGVWLMPDNSKPGELENFVAKLVPRHDPVWPLAERYIDGIPSKDRRLFAGKELRAKLHAWLATRARPHPMGTAIRSGALDANVPAAEKLIAWLTALFGADAS